MLSALKTEESCLFFAFYDIPSTWRWKSYTSVHTRWGILDSTSDSTIIYSFGSIVCWISCEYLFCSVCSLCLMSCLYRYTTRCCAIVSLIFWLPSRWRLYLIEFFNSALLCMLLMIGDCGYECNVMVWWCSGMVSGDVVVWCCQCMVLYGVVLER